MDRPERCCSPFWHGCVAIQEMIELWRTALGVTVTHLQGISIVSVDRIMYPGMHL